jgi:hypothetical protein
MSQQPTDQEIENTVNGIYKNLTGQEKAQM